MDERFSEYAFRTTETGKLQRAAVKRGTKTKTEKKVVLRSRKTMDNAYDFDLNTLPFYKNFMLVYNQKGVGNFPETARYFHDSTLNYINEIAKEKSVVYAVSLFQKIASSILPNANKSRATPCNSKNIKEIFSRSVNKLVKRLCDLLLAPNERDSYESLSQNVKRETFNLLYFLIMNKETYKGHLSDLPNSFQDLWLHWNVPEMLNEKCKLVDEVVYYDVLERAHGVETGARGARRSDNKDVYKEHPFKPNRKNTVDPEVLVDFTSFCKNGERSDDDDDDDEREGEDFDRKEIEMQTIDYIGLAIGSPIVLDSLLEW